MDDYILISWLNDFIFCPVSIYFHQLYGSKETLLYKNRDQISGKAAHKTVDEKSYSTRKDVLQGISVVSEKYGLMGKIDVFDVTKGVLTERKKRIVNIYDGYVFQLYAQYFALMEMGYIVSRIRFHSLDDNKNYDIQLPSEDHMMRVKFESTVKAIRDFSLDVNRNGAYILKWENNGKYIGFLMQPILQKKVEIFMYVQSYYRAFMKGKNADEFPVFLIR